MFFNERVFMISMRAGADRGYADHGWLKSFHSFSFASFHDPRFMGFGPLRVINEDRVAAGKGFGTHGHRDMEIISYVLEGALAHQDSMGNGSVIRPGDVQRMSAGTGVQHSEFNHEASGETHFLQIWIQPSQSSTPPGYEEKHFNAASKRGQLRLIASELGEQGSVRIQQDAKIYAGLFDLREQAQLTVSSDRLVYVQLARGALKVNDRELRAGDALYFQNETQLILSDGQEAEVLVFDLPQI
jgi:quercetin 2,3-dioxygenase